MSDTYKGDSPGKKVARINFWADALNLARPYTEESPRVLVLPGRECGDIRALRALGVSPAAITGAETSTDAFESARSLFPQSDIQNRDVLELSGEPEYRRAFDICLLDFCAPLSGPTVMTFVNVASRCVRHAGVAAVGFMYGREKDTDLRSALRLRSNEMYDEFTSIDGMKSTHAKSAASHAARIVVGTTAIARAAARRGVCTEYIGRVVYHSRTRTTHGVPMMYLVFRIVRAPGRSPGSIYRTFERGLKGGLCVVNTGGDVAKLESHIHNASVALAKKHGSTMAADAFNLRPSVVAAWLAHDTRGTYAEAG